MKTFLQRNWWLIAGIMGLMLVAYFSREQQLATFAATVSTAQTFQPAPVVAPAQPAPSTTIIPAAAFRIAGWAFLVFVVGLIVIGLIWLVSLAYIALRARQLRLVAAAPVPPPSTVLDGAFVATSPAPRRVPPQPALPAPRAAKPAPVVIPAIDSPSVPMPEPWTVLGAQELSKLIERLGVTPTSETLVANRWKRIVDLQAALGAHTVRHAADHSVAMFVGITCGQDELERKCAPQPAKIVVEGGVYSAVVGLVHQQVVAHAQAPVAPSFGPVLEPTSTEQAKPTSPLIPQTTWLKIVQNSPDLVPHILIVAPTGAGKTTLAQTLAALRTEDQIAILDMKWEKGKWGGAAAVPIDDDGKFTQLERACQALLLEMQQRMAAFKRGEKVLLKPLTIVVEELPTTIGECPTAALLFKRVGQLGRELRMRMIGLTQSDRVKTLGLAGEGDARRNYCFIWLGEMAVEICPDSSSMERPAALVWRGTHRIDTTGIMSLMQPIPAERWWVLPEVSSVSGQQSAVVELLSPEPVPGSASTANVDPAGSEVGTSDTTEESVDGSFTDTTSITGAIDAEMIRTLYNAGWTYNKIAARLTGRRQDRLAYIRAALDHEKRPTSVPIRITSTA